MVIRLHTTLVLGAGASVPYGFPSGEGLRSRVLDILAQGDGTSAMNVMRELGFTIPQCNTLYQALLESGVHSIDAFLEDQPRFLELGRTAIAMALIPCEQPTRTLAPPAEVRPWYDLLLQAMRPPAEFAKNSLRVVTFNYDRSLEFVLFKHIKRACADRENGLPDAACTDIVSKIPIVHVYGQLGALPWQGGERVRSYEPDWEADKVFIAREGIRLITDREGQNTEESVAVAREFVNTADRVYFVGFSYDETNMKRLGLVNEKNKRKWVKGTAFGMGDAQRRAVSGKWPIETYPSDARRFFTEDFQLE